MERVGKLHQQQSSDYPGINTNTLQLKNNNRTKEITWKERYINQLARNQRLETLLAKLKEQMRLLPSPRSHGCGHQTKSYSELSLMQLEHLLQQLQRERTELEQDHCVPSDHDSSTYRILNEQTRQGKHNQGNKSSIHAHK